MADLKVDFAALSDSSASLQHIADAFESLRSRASGSEQDWGSRDIAGAMGSFSGDWDNHREKIIASVKATKGMVDQALDGFRQVDGQLGDALQTEGSGTGRAR